ncbi:PREDICTED: alpha/beta-gliadin A-IV-like [Chaetura pelagica]|uniref:alpha/beta-gliadin A-IV-like n=1 Tax=Chaetura pelagica TaxID=8897 RepID=UPI000523DB03|nr:PREDICTED: alpha/beta-gliadin A-IV-like [Chaetura pelagica]
MRSQKLVPLSQSSPPCHKRVPLVPPGRVARQSVTLPPDHPRRRPFVGQQGVSMAWTPPFSQSFQPNNPDGDRDAASASEPDPSRREDHFWHREPSQATPPATVNPRQQEEARQGEGSGNSLVQQQQQVRAEDLLHLVQEFNGAAWLRKKKQRMKKKYFNKENKLGQQGREDLTEQYPCAPSSSGFRRKSGQQGQRRSPVHGTRKQHRRARRRRRDRRRSQQQRRTEPLHQDQAGGQSSSGQDEGLLWNVKKCCWAKISQVPEEILQEASRRLRPMNMAGYCLPGMCTPHHTRAPNQYTWRNEEESVAVISGGSCNYSTAAEDFLLVDPLPSMVQKDEFTSTEEEEEEYEERTEIAHQE